MNSAKIIRDIDKVIAALNESEGEVYFTVTPAVAEYYKHELAKEYEVEYETKVEQPVRRVRMELDRRIYIVQKQHTDIIQWESKAELDQYLAANDAE